MDNDREESQVITTVYAQGPKRLKFIVQAIIAVIIISFSVTQIMINTTKESSCDSPDNTVWIGLICTILGLFFPQPTPNDTTEILRAAVGIDEPLHQQQQEEKPVKVSQSTHIRSRPATPAPKYREIKKHNLKKADNTKPLAA